VLHEWRDRSLLRPRPAPVASRTAAPGSACEASSTTSAPESRARSSWPARTSTATTSAHEPGQFQRVQAGTDGVQQALRARKGGQNEAKIGTGFTVITKGNIDRPEGKAAAYQASC